MRVVLDVNILASASVFRDRVPWRLTEPGLRGDYNLFISNEMLVALEYVLSRNYFVR